MHTRARPFDFNFTGIGPGYARATLQFNSIWICHKYACKSTRRSLTQTEAASVSFDIARLDNRQNALFRVLFPTPQLCHIIIHLTAREFQAYTLMKQLYTANKEKLRKRKEKMEEKRNLHRAENAKLLQKRQRHQKEERRKIFRLMGQAEKRKKSRRGDD